MTQNSDTNILPLKDPVLIMPSVFHFKRFPDDLTRERERKIEIQSYIPVRYLKFMKCKKPNLKMVSKPNFRQTREH